MSEDEKQENAGEEEEFENFLPIEGVEDEILGNEPFQLSNDFLNFSGYVRNLREPIWTSFSWETFKSGIKSGGKYQKRIDDFKTFYDRNKYSHLHEGLLYYFVENQKLIDEETGLNLHAPSTLNSWYSVFKQFFTHTNQGDLDKELPILNIKLGHWDRDYETKKSKVFSKEDLEDLLQL